MTERVVYRDTNFKPETLARIVQAQNILAEYDQKLTVRQLYYQFVSRLFIPNEPRSYANLTGIITDARYAGLISWDAIEDRGREPDTPSEWDSVDDVVETAMRAFRLPRWAGQKHYVELWVEKQALAGVLEPIAKRHHVTLMVNKGYSSASAMYESAQRMIQACEITVGFFCRHCECDERDDEICANCYKPWKPEAMALSKDGTIDIDRTPVVLYLGDHDPSGEDMVRDIRDRLKEFGVTNLEVVKLALTMKQIQKWKPPPNPAKLTDSRAKEYIKKFGTSSWELDALPPRTLNDLVDAAIGALVDLPMMNKVIEEENRQRTRMRHAIAMTKED